jgi:hypothetical protein
MTIETWATIASLITSIIFTGISFGILKEKVRMLEKQADELESELKSHEKEDSLLHEKFVSFQHLETVLGPIEKSLEIVQKDIKEILRVVGTS